MSKYFKKFDTVSEYEEYMSSSALTLPNVSLIGTDDVRTTANHEGPGPTPTHDYSQDYLTIVMLEDGSVGSGYMGSDCIYFSRDGGNTWVTNPDFEDLLAGDRVLIKGDSFEAGEYSPFSVSGAYNIEGNIMSIHDSQGFRTRTTLRDESATPFRNMFNESYFLVSAENLVLPLTTASTNCYQAMFSSCFNLTTPPKLPATTLEYSCYQAMFTSCQNLTRAPELPASTLAEYCYNDMFSGCLSLNYVKCLATDISANSCVENWLNGVSGTGTLVKDPNMNDWEAGSNIPDGWTIENAN